MKSAYKKIKGMERLSQSRFYDRFRMINGWINLKTYGGVSWAYSRKDLVHEIRSALQFGDNANWLFDHFEISRDCYIAPSHHAWRNGDNLPCSREKAVEDLPF